MSRTFRTTPPGNMHQAPGNDPGSCESACQGIKALLEMSTAKWHWHCRKAAVGSQTSKIHRLQELPYWHNLLRRDEETPSACIAGQDIRHAGPTRVAGHRAVAPSANHILATAAAPTRFGTPMAKRGTNRLRKNRFWMALANTMVRGHSNAMKVRCTTMGDAQSGMGPFTNFGLGSCLTGTLC